MLPGSPGVLGLCVGVPTSGDDEEEKVKAAKAWTRWEMTTSQLEPTAAKAGNAEDAKVRGNSDQGWVGGLRVE